MFVHGAVKKAMEEGKGIKRTGWEMAFEGIIVIPSSKRIPLDVDNIGKAQCRKPNWNPTPDDLMADDWEVTKV